MGVDHVPNNEIGQSTSTSGGLWSATHDSVTDRGTILLAAKAFRPNRIANNNPDIIH
jgi:hypothetical protein